MSVDPNQITSPAPILDTSTLISAAVTPVATEVAQHVVAGVQRDLVSLQAAFAAHQTEVAQQLASAGGAVVTTLETDRTLQRVVVLAVLAALLVAAITILVAALLGNSTANRWIGGVPIGLGLAAAWISQAAPVRPTAKTAPGSQS